MKIVVQCFNYAPHELGGSERSARELARGLAARGHDLRILVSDGSKPYPEAVDDLPLDVVEGLPIGRSPLHGARRFAARMAWNLRGETDPVLLARSVRYLRRHRPDVVVMNNPAGHGTALMAAARLTGTPVVPVIRDWGWFCAFGTLMRGGQGCEGACTSCTTSFALRRAALRRLPVLVAISEHVATVGRRLLGSANLQVIYNSVPEAFLDTPRLPPPADDAPLRFGYLGRLHPAKGVSELLAAWRLAGLHQSGHRLQLAGGNQGIEIPADAAALGIEVLGPQPALAFLDGLDVLVLPALWAEPFGRTAVEALARGLYVLASGQGGLPELVPPGRGQILPQVDPQSLAAALTELASRPGDLRRIRLQDPSAALAAFRSTRMLDAYEVLLHDLVARARAS